MEQQQEQNPMEKAEREGRVRFDPDTERWVSVSSWRFVDLEPSKRGDRPILEPVYLRRSDGAALLYPGRAHAFVGESETLKSWAAILACKSVFDLGRRSLYIDFEDEEDTFVRRARLAKIPDDALGETVRYMRPDETLLTPNSAADLEISMTEFRPSLVVLDGVTEAYALHGWSINEATDAAKWQHLVRDAIRSGGAASVEIDHTGKDLGRGAVGSQHKRAGINGAQFEFSIGVPPDVDHAGFSYVSVTKDRHGQVRKHTPEGSNDLGTLNIDPTGLYGVVLAPPESSESRRASTDAAFLKAVDEDPGIATGPLALVLRRRTKDVRADGLRLAEAGLIQREQGGNAVRFSPKD